MSVEEAQLIALLITIYLFQQLPDNTFTNSPFSTLHGNSQSPFEGGLTSNKIPDPIPLPGNAAALSQSLAAADPPTTHIPFPTDEMSGYRGYAGASSSIDTTSAIGNPAEERNEQFSGLQDVSCRRVDVFFRFKRSESAISWAEFEILY